MSFDYTNAARLIRKGRRAEQRGKALTGCITSLLTSALAGLMGGWMPMLAVGVAHIHWIHALPTIGYWWAVLLVVLLRGVFSRTPKTDDRS
jgi:hypothetical protein